MYIEAHFYGGKQKSHTLFTPLINTFQTLKIKASPLKYFLWYSFRLQKKSNFHQWFLIFFTKYVTILKSVFEEFFLNSMICICFTVTSGPYEDRIKNVNMTSQLPTKKLFWILLSFLQTFWVFRTTAVLLFPFYSTMIMSKIRDFHQVRKCKFQLHARAF